ncbi:alpha-galactosidase [Chitinophaga arvensicola]|nr:hypothetical protein [Chitinophaga arvensicola]
MLCLSVSLYAQQTATIPFGKNNRIVYDLRNGTYAVWAGGKAVIRHAYAFYDESTSPDTARVPRSMKVATIPNGKQYTITSAAGGLKREHVFYVYNNDDAFYTAVVLRGTGARSRYMSPLTGESIPYTSGVFVPFDNDAWIKYRVVDLAGAGFTASEVTAVYDSVSNAGIVLGSVEHNNWKTGIRVAGGQLSAIAGWTDSLVTRDGIRHGIVTQGDTLCSSPKIMVAVKADWRKGMEQYAVANRRAEPRYIFNWKGAKPFGWNSWGSMQTKLTLPKAKQVVDFFADSCKAFRSKDGNVYIDLDSYWDNLTQGGMTGDFSQLKAFADYCKQRGVKPGIYWAPFVDWSKSPRTVEGSHYNYEEVWTKVNGQYHDFDGCRAMDPTHPATRERIAYLIKRFKEAGFEMIKIDFIGHAAIEADHYYDPSVHTGMQAFRKGMEFLVDQLDSKMLVYAAISPSMATGRYVHTRRIACDAFKSIDETAYTLNATSLGWWQSKVYDYADADHVVFEGASIGANRARLTSAIVTGTIITGDDYSEPGSAHVVAQQLLQNKEVLQAAQLEDAFLPVDHHTGEAPSNLFVYNASGYTYLAVLNYGKQAATFSAGLDKLGLNTKQAYRCKELFSGKISEVKGTLQVSVDAADAVIIRLEAMRTR